MKKRRASVKQDGGLPEAGASSLDELVEAAELLDQQEPPLPVRSAASGEDIDPLLLDPAD